MSRIDFMDVSQAADLASLERNLVSMSANLGFPLVGGVLTHLGATPRTPRAVYAVSNTPEAYMETFTDLELTLRDPVITRLREQRFQPITYDQDFYVKGGAADLWEEQAPFGYRCGIAVSLDLPNHWRFAFGIDRDQPVPNGAELISLQAHLLLLAVHAQAAAFRLLPNKSTSLQQAEALPSLSNRELECLKWTRDSKTAWEVGMILGISERTVNAHISSAMRKLGCFSKHQAMLKAMDLGLIS
jgi:LuxR family transcriptional regulator